MNTPDDTRLKLLKIIEKNGPDYLQKRPYEVFQVLVNENTDKKMAGAVLCLLVSNAVNLIKAGDDLETASEIIRNSCGFDQSMSETLAKLFLSLYSRENMDSWKKKDGEGARQFLREPFTCVWNGFFVWDAGNGTIDCICKAEIELAPLALSTESEDIKKMLAKNPFTTKDEIAEYFRSCLNNYLDEQFEEYCDADDYYQPVVEDFYIESSIEEWCKKNGFKCVDYGWDGYDQEYEPKYRGRF